MFTEKKPGAPHVALVSCSASKSKKSAPAWELYTSELFGAAYTCAEKTYDAELIVSALYGVIAPKEEITNVNETEMAFKVLTAKLLDAANRFSSQESSDTIRAYCIVLLDLGWQGDGAVSIRDGLHKVAFYAASGAVEETRIGVRQIGNMVNGREWYNGNGRADS